MLEEYSQYMKKHRKQGLELTSVISQSAEDLLPLDSFVAGPVARLTHGQVDGYLTFSIIQEAGTVWVIWEEEPSNHSKDACRYSLDNEQYPPWSDAPSGLGDAICQGTTISVGSSRARQENPSAQSKLFSRIEKTQVQRHPGSVGGFEYGEKHPAYHDASPVVAGGLDT